MPLDPDVLSFVEPMSWLATDAELTVEAAAVRCAAARSASMSLPFAALAAADAEAAAAWLAEV